MEKTPFNIFVSGDGKDKAYIWQIVPDLHASEDVKMEEDQNNQSISSVASLGVSKFKTKLLHELPGHTETVELAKFSSDGRFLVTGGMNNLLRVWDVDANFSLKLTIDSIPQEDMSFVDWHPKAPLILTGGKDYMVWLVNAVTGKIMASLAGHDMDITFAMFSLHD